MALGFVDAVLLRLADATARAQVFDEIALRQLIAAAHDLDGLDLTTPITPIFDDVRFSFQDDRRVDVTGTWMMVGHTEHTELALRAAGLGPSVPRIDMLWTGKILATSPGGNAIVDRVRGGFVASADPNSQRAELTVHYADAADTPAARRAFGVAVALVLRPADASIAELMDETRRIRPYLTQLGFAPPCDAGDRSKRAPVIAWVLPGEIFDDAAWLGATSTMSADQKRAARRTWAGGWLAREGIGLVVPPN